MWYGDGGSGQWPGTLQGADPDPDPSAGSQGFAINPGTFGSGTYTYRISSDDAYGNMTAWSTPQSASLAGDPGLAPDLSVDGTSITATWPATDGPEAVYVEPDGTAPLIGDGAALPTVPYGTLSTDESTYSSTMSDLIPGTKYDFVLYTPAIDGVPPLFGDANATTAGTAPLAAPASPDGAVATWHVPTEPGIFLHWHNNPSNETGYEIFKSTGGTGFDLSSSTEIGATAADVTTFDDAGATRSTGNFLRNLCDQQRCVFRRIRRCRCGRQRRSYFLEQAEFNGRQVLSPLGHVGYCHADNSKLGQFRQFKYHRHTGENHLVGFRSGHRPAG